MKVGFIGVGNMGGPMCRNIIRNTNHDVVVFDLNPAAIKVCTDLGATAGTSVAQIAADCDVVFTSLPMPRNVEEVALGAGGVAETAKAGTVYVDLSTNSPATARRVNEGMRAKGIQMLEAPVSGGTARATDGTLELVRKRNSAGADPGAQERGSICNFYTRLGCWDSCERALFAHGTGNFLAGKSRSIA